MVQPSDLLNVKSQIEGADKIYFFHYLTDLTDPQKLTEHFIKDTGFIEKETKDFSGVGFVTVYEKNFAFH